MVDDVTWRKTVSSVLSSCRGRATRPRSRNRSPGGRGRRIPQRVPVDSEPSQRQTPTRAVGGRGIRFVAGRRWGDGSACGTAPVAADRGDRIVGALPGHGRRGWRSAHAGSATGARHAAVRYCRWHQPIWSAVARGALPGWRRLGSAVGDSPAPPVAISGRGHQGTGVRQAHSIMAGILGVRAPARLCRPRSRPGLPAPLRFPTAPGWRPPCCGCFGLTEPTRSRAAGGGSSGLARALCWPRFCSPPSQHQRLRSSS